MVVEQPQPNADVRSSTSYSGGGAGLRWSDDEVVWDGEGCPDDDVEEAGEEGKEEDAGD